MKKNRISLIIFVLFTLLVNQKTAIAKTPVKMPYRNSWLFTVGISKYEKLPYLNYPQYDAKYFEEHLSKLGFNKTLNLLNEDATSANILNSINQDLKNNLTKDDRLLIFISGRSYTEEKNGKKSAYLLTYDSKSKDDKKNSISLTTLKKSLKGIKAKHIFLIIDTTISGTLVNSKNDAPYYKNINSLKTRIKNRSLKILTAGRDFEPMDPYGDKSLFTKILVKAFNGDADKNSNGLINANELSSYIRSRVSYESNNKQFPEYGRWEGNGEMLFAAKEKNPLNKKVNYSMVFIAGGNFLMGSPGVLGKRSEKPAHSVYLNPFYIGKFEVTNAKYKIFMEDSSRRAPDNWSNPDYNDPAFPVVGVSHKDATDFCRWLGKRLPTEAEWEKAARGNEWQKYPWGSDNVNDDNIIRANTLETEGVITKVGSFTAGKSPYGAYDMAGNVWEWVEDWYSSSYYRVSEKINPLGPAKPNQEGVKVLRGGSWNSSSFNARSSYRNSINKDFTFKDIGFRCAE